jgi:hypothetical protein
MTRARQNLKASLKEEEMTPSEKRQIAKDVVAPIVMRILQTYSAADMTTAINTNVDIAEGLRENMSALDAIVTIAQSFPGYEQIEPYIKQRSWIVWFINAVLAKDRPDLYAAIVYNPNGINYVVDQLKNVVAVIFE